MNWLRVTVQLGALDPAAIESALLELGAIAIDYRDGADDPILEPAPGETPLWSSLSLSALLPPQLSHQQVRRAIDAALSGAELPGLRFSRLAERDWVGAWKESLHALKFGSDLWVCPRDSEPPDPSATIVWLEPGLAFGSGAHPTTALCLEWIASTVRGGELLDYGCGSGLLAIAALRKGARRATAVDNDPQALLATRANAQSNDCSNALEVSDVQALTPGRRYDLVVANILSGTLIELAPRLAAHCRAGTRLALSGILETQADQVRQAYAPWFPEMDLRERDGWILLTGPAQR